MVDGALVVVVADTEIDDILDSEITCGCPAMDGVPDSEIVCGCPAMDGVPDGGEIARGCPAIDDALATDSCAKVDPYPLGSAI